MRKSKSSAEGTQTAGVDLSALAARVKLGEPLATVAAELGWSAQALSKRLRNGMPRNGAAAGPAPAAAPGAARRPKGRPPTRPVNTSPTTVTATPKAFYDAGSASKPRAGVFGQAVFDPATGRQNDLYGAWVAVERKAGQALTEKYRPRKLDQVVGQDAAVAQLRVFAAEPYPCAFVFEGDTGTGKTSAAKALAGDLGVAAEYEELGGLREIASGELSAEAVRETAKGMRTIPFYGSGWKVIVCNEADRMSPQAEAVWLDVLENLTGKTVVVFTTNHVDKLSRRVLDRCQRVAFTSDPRALAPHVRTLVDTVWRIETGREDGCPASAEELEAETLDPDTGAASFRRAVQLVTRKVRENRAASENRSAS